MPLAFLSYRIFGFWFVVSAIMLATSIATLWWPIARDQGGFAWVGHVICNGGMPYRDAWEVKGPTAVLPYALVETIFGRNMWGIRVFDLLMTFFGMVAVFSIARSWRDKKTGWYAVAILAFAVNNEDFWMRGQPDGWCGYIIAAAIALLAGTRRPASTLRFGAAGLCLSLCFLQKPTYGICLLLLIPALIWKAKQESFWPATAASAIGFLVPVALFVTWAHSRGALSSFVECFLLYSLRTHAQIELYTASGQFFQLLYGLSSVVPFSQFFIPSLLGGIAILRAAKFPANMFSLWFCLGTLLVVIQRKYFPYHWFPLYPWLAVGTAIALREGDKLVISLSRFLRFRASQLAFLWFAVVCLLLPIHYLRLWKDYLLGHQSLAEYQGAFTFLGSDYYWFHRIQAISDYVRAHTEPNESVSVWGFDADVNFLSDRPAPSRFGHASPLEVGPHSPFWISYRAEFLLKVLAKPPAYFVIADNDANVLLNESSRQALEDFRGLSDFVKARYVLETTIDNWQLWHLQKLAGTALKS